MNEQTTASVTDIGIERGRRLLKDLATIERNGAAERRQKMECWREYGAVLLPLRKQNPGKAVFAKVLRDAGLDTWPAQDSQTRSDAMWLASLDEICFREITKSDCLYTRPTDIRIWARKQKFAWMPPPKKRPPPPEPTPSVAELRSELPESARTRFDRTLAKALDTQKKELAASYQQAHWQAVTAEVERRLPKHAAQELASARAAHQAAQALEGVWRTRAHACKEIVRLFLDNFRVIASVLHPDRAPPERLEQFNRAMETMNRIKAAVDKTAHEKW